MMRTTLERIDVEVLRLPTERPESDGTATWDATTMVLARPYAAGVAGLGYSYVDAAAAVVIRDLLAPAIVGRDAMALPAARAAMLEVVRNHGRAGIAACAISAVDVALWDLKAKLLEVPLATLLGVARERVPVYASGGFTSSDLDELAEELAGYVAAGHTRVKIKIGREPARDVDRVAAARRAIGPAVELMVDANGAYDRKQALAFAERFADYGVCYFEEPVSSDDREGLRLLRDRAPASIAIAAGEYGYDTRYFECLLDAVDIVQADATRALGVTGFLEANTLCAARSMPLSSHCAPAIHVHACAAANRIVHLEYFRDHARFEQLVFEGAVAPVSGELVFDPRRDGLGISLRAAEAARYAA